MVGRGGEAGRDYHLRHDAIGEQVEPKLGTNNAGQNLLW